MCVAPTRVDFPVIGVATAVSAGKVWLLSTTPVTLSRKWSESLR